MAKKKNLPNIHQTQENLMELIRESPRSAADIMWVYGVSRWTARGRLKALLVKKLVTFRKAGFHGKDPKEGCYEKMYRLTALSKKVLDNRI